VSGLKSLVIASTNPVKVEAARRGFAAMFPDETFTARGLSVPSGVGDQPMSDDETYQGALNRAQNARREAPEADFWVGIEGGIEERHGEMLAFAWVVVLSGQRAGSSRTATFTLPDALADLVRQGVELGAADDIIFGRSNSKQANGAVGILTDDAIDRTAYYQHAVILALVPFKNPTLAFGGG
jgi:inosine/xanthosine triphosphatase